MNEGVVDFLTFEPWKACHILMLLPRQKDWFRTWEKRTRARHYFVDSREQWNDKVEYMKRLIKEWEQWRIYSTYNPRSLAKWARNMLKLIWDWMVWGNYEFLMRWKWLIASCLKKWWTIYCKDYFMVDIDTKDVGTLQIMIDKANKWDYRQKDCYVSHFPTPNWYHMLIKPMDKRVFYGIENIELKNDEFIFISK